MSVCTKDNFPEIRSAPNWFLTWCIRLLFLVLFGPLTILIYTIPLAFYMDGTIAVGELSAFGIFYYPLLIWMSYLLVRYLKRIKGNAVKHVRVNRAGIFYECLNGSVVSLLYQQLESASNDAVYDVFSKAGGRYSPTVLSVFMKGSERTVHFGRTDVAYSYYTGNIRLLRRHFIQGIVLFRPELRIAPFVYSNFFIDPETFEFDKKAYRKAIIAATILLLFIFLGIEWYMRYRFGHSLIF